MTGGLVFFNSILAWRNSNTNIKGQNRIFAILEIRNIGLFGNDQPIVDRGGAWART